jgi:aspartyl-tRNA(Asn)/glutamyl-tRNA(Gln) amidotransferase subunit B
MNVELKNVNSIPGVKNGISDEIQRQQQVFSQGADIAQETRKWNADNGIAMSMCSRQMVNDYRHFPNRDLGPLEMKRVLIDEFQQLLPELPLQKQGRLFITYDLRYPITSVFYPHSSLCDYFEEIVKVCN